MNAMAAVMPQDRLLRAFPPKPYTATHGDGVWLTMADGRRAMDLGGASHGTAIVGHNHPDVTQAIRDATRRVMHVNGNVPNPDRDAFLARLHAMMPAHLTRTFLANSGAEAVECAVKLAITEGRHEIVAIDGGFHGRTLGALAVTGNEAYRAPFAGRLASTRFVAPDDIDALTTAVTEQTAAVVVEPVLGEGGVRPLSSAFLEAVRLVTARHGALFIADEVQTGFRTGIPLASAPFTPDIVTVGKGLAGGLPIGACLVSDAVAARLPPAGHGSTYGGAPLVCAAGGAALGLVAEHMSRAPAIEAGFRAALQHAAISDVRGRGAMLAIALRIRAKQAMPVLEQHGILALPAGTRAIRILPPLTMTDAEVAEACRRICAALDAVVA